MKKTECIALSSLLLLSSWQVADSQLAGNPSTSQTDIATNPSSPTNYTVIQRGPHQRVVRYLTVETNSLGARSIIRTNSHSYMEIETGMHRKNAQGDWTEASEEIDSVPGGAVGTNTAHQAFFAANANNSEAVRLTMPGGRVLASHVLCLSYYDAISGSNAIIADLQDSIGQVLPPNRVLYTNALSGDCVADVVYHNTKAGIEQNIILRSQPPPPAEYGISNAMLQVWTEFVSGPTPTVFPPNNPSVSADEQLDFGGMMIGPGKAIIMGGATGSAVQVQKQWVETQGRRFLVEQVPWELVTSQLQQLPPSSGGNGSGAQGQHASLSPVFFKPRFAQAKTNVMQLAKVQVSKKPGFVMDYNMTSATNFIFQADTTYYISGSVYLAGSNVFEGGCVLKYAANAVLNVYPTTSTPTISFLSTAFRPVTFTAKDDQSIGDIISGSASSPSGYYANPALFLAGLSSTPSIAHVRIAYANQGIVTSGVSINTSDAQFVNCSNPFQLVGGTVSLRNVLMANCVTNFVLQGGIALSAENTTFAACNLAAGPSSPGGCTMSLTNCILANVTNLTTGVLSLSGDTNGFWNSPTVGNVVTNTSYPFQVVGAGGFYLANGCSFRNAGTPNINSTLLSSLGQKTTYPPIVLSNIITIDTILSPQAQRDTDTPDLGYHYDPIDYAFQNVQVSNSVLQVTPGTVLSMAGFSYGLEPKRQSKIICQGSATNLVRIVRYNMVQERSNTNWDTIARSIVANGWTDTPAPELHFNFTDWSMPAQDANQFESFYNPSTFSFVNSQFHGGKFEVLVPNLYVTNCLFERVKVAIGDDTVGIDISPIIRNCLFFGGQLNLTHWNSDTWLFRDNAFDQATITQDGNVDDAYDGYITGSNRLTPTNAHDVVTNVIWQANFLGNYYQPANSAFINVGSLNANSVGLYHFTVTTNLISGLQIKETNSVVDIGFHYVASDGSGKPIDTNGDGLPDYLSDANGDGLVDSGETAWNVANDVGLGIWISRPGNN